MVDNAAITIYAHLNESDLIVDSVLNSPIYNRAAQFYRDLNRLKADEKNDFYIKSFKENADNPFSLEIATRFLNQNSMFKEALAEMKSMIDVQGNVYYGRPDHQNLVDKMYSLMRMEEIDLRKYDFIDRQGNSVKLLAPKAEFYVLDFWFVNCLPCRVDHKKIMANYNLFDQHNIGVIGLSIDRNHREWNDYLDEHNYAWTNYRIEKGNSLTDDLVVSAYPTYYLFDKDLKYQGVFSNIDEFAYLFLDKLL